MTSDDFSFSYGNYKITVEGAKTRLTITSNNEMKEYPFSSIFKIILMKSSRRVRLLYYAIIFGIIGIILFATGLLQIHASGGIGLVIAGVLFIMVAVLLFRLAVAPKYFLTIMTSKGNERFKVKPSPELNVFIENANAIIATKNEAKSS